MSSFEPSLDGHAAAEPLTDWEQWDDRGDVSDSPAATARHDLEVIPSLWADSGEAAQRSARRRVIIIVALAAGAATAIMWWLLHPHGDTSNVTITSAAPATSALDETSSESEVAAPTVNTPVPTGQPTTGPAAGVAARFASDYANTDGGKDAWFARISRWTAPQLTDGYRLTDPHRLPNAVFQRLSPPLNSDSGTVIYDAFYNTMALEIRVAFVEDRWLVVAALDTTPPQGDSSPPSDTSAPTAPSIPTGS